MTSQCAQPTLRNLIMLRVRDELDDHLLEAREERAPSIGCRLADAARC